jgi:hypothetical protein
VTWCILVIGTGAAMLYRDVCGSGESVSLGGHVVSGDVMYLCTRYLRAVV